jgi:hypothetical protein
MLDDDKKLNKIKFFKSQGYRQKGCRIQVAYLDGDKERYALLKTGTEVTVNGQIEKLYQPCRFEKKDNIEKAPIYTRTESGIETLRQLQDLEIIHAKSGNIIIDK